MCFKIANYYNSNECVYNQFKVGCFEKSVFWEKGSTGRITQKIKDFWRKRKIISKTPRQDKNQVLEAEILKSNKIYL